jgi:2,4-diaminopentanoate dehydrogenase
MAYRVVQWGTGAVGMEAIRGILDHPDLELAGIKVYSDEKIGCDAGDLVGSDPVGVPAAKHVDTADIDAVLCAPRHPDVDEAAAILASGANLVTTAFAFHPARMEPRDRDRLQQACAAGNSSLHGTGLNPGNLGVVVPIALSGMSRSIEHVTVQERADWSVYDSVEITFDQMRFGSPLDEVTANTDGPKFTSELFQQQVWLLGDALGLGVDEVSTDLELIPASVDRDICGRTLRAGTVAGQHWRWTGRRDGHRVVQVETLWTVGEPQPPHWPTPQHGWTVTIEGTPSMQAHLMTLASFRRDVPLAEHVRSASVATARSPRSLPPARVS